MTGAAVRPFCWRLVASIAITLCASLVADSPGAKDLATPAYLNPSLAPQARAADLIRQMTLEEKASQLVNHSRAIPRLGVPAYDWWSEALHGVAVKGTTEFPEPIGLAATFDTAAFTRWPRTSASKAASSTPKPSGRGTPRTFEGLDFWSPNINIFRDPRWGRGQETYGEDPFLTGRHGASRS